MLTSVTSLTSVSAQNQVQFSNFSSNGMVVKYQASVTGFSWGLVVPTSEAAVTEPRPYYLADLCIPIIVGQGVSVATLKTGGGSSAFGPGRASTCRWSAFSITNLTQVQAAVAYMCLRLTALACRTATSPIELSVCPINVVHTVCVRRCICRRANRLISFLFIHDTAKRCCSTRFCWTLLLLSMPTSSAVNIVML